jgi:hypothetical protein
MKLNQLRRIFIGAILTLMIIGMIFGVLTYLRGDWRLPYDDVRIENLMVCEEPNKIASSDSDGSQIISSNSAYLQACGQLATESPINLGFYLFKEPKSKSIDNNPAGQKYHAGWFNQQMLLPQENRQGHYRIDVYLFRNIIASTEFDVINP